VAAAAKRAGISTARWSQIEQGHETRDGERRPATAPADTLAYMAAAIGLPAGRLETEGQRPDAAAVLREMQRPQGGDPPAAAETPPPPAGREPLTGPWTYGDEILERIWRLPGLDQEGLSDAGKRYLIALARGLRAERERLAEAPHTPELTTDQR
jgi:hypothetical protein